MRKAIIIGLVLVIMLVLAGACLMTFLMVKIQEL